MHRWLVISSEGGIVRHASSFKELKKAESWADEIGTGLNPEYDAVIVWDLKFDMSVYDPLKSKR